MTGAAPITAAPAFRPLPGAMRLRSLGTPEAAVRFGPAFPEAAPARLSALQADTASFSTNATARPSAAGASGFVAPSFGKGLEAQRSFSESLGALARAAGAESRLKRTETDRAREAAEKLVSTTLVEPILKQLRETNNAAPPFGATPAEKQFGALLDHRLAQDIVQSANLPIVDRVARDLLRNRGDSA